MARIARGVAQAALAVGAALPGELYFDAVVALGGEEVARHAHDQGGLAAVYRRLGVDEMAGGVCIGSAVGHAQGQCQRGVAVKNVRRGAARFICLGCGCLLRRAGVWGDASAGKQGVQGGGSSDGSAIKCTSLRLEVCAQVVARMVDDAQHGVGRWVFAVG